MTNLRKGTKGGASAESPFEKLCLCSTGVTILIGRLGFGRGGVDSISGVGTLEGRARQGPRSVGW